MKYKSWEVVQCVKIPSRFYKSTRQSKIKDHDSNHSQIKAFTPNSLKISERWISHHKRSHPENSTSACPRFLSSYAAVDFQDTRTSKRKQGSKEKRKRKAWSATYPQLREADPQPRGTYVVTYMAVARGHSVRANHPSAQHSSPALNRRIPPHSAPSWHVCGSVVPLCAPFPLNASEWRRHLMVCPESASTGTINNWAKTVHFW